MCGEVLLELAQKGKVTLTPVVQVYQSDVLGFCRHRAESRSLIFTSPEQQTSHDPLLPIAPRGKDQEQEK